MKHSRHSSDGLIPCQAFRTTFEGIAEVLLACQFEDSWVYQLLLVESSLRQSLLLLLLTLFCGMDSDVLWTSSTSLDITSSFRLFGESNVFIVELTCVGINIPWYRSGVKWLVIIVISKTSPVLTRHILT